MKTLEDRMRAVPEAERGKFERVHGRLANRKDLHAFLLIDKLVPGTGRIIAAAAHDQIWIGCDTEALNMMITDSQVVDLVRCGVMWSDDALSMFA